MYSVYLSNKVNTETAEYRSRRFQVFLYLNNSTLKCQPQNEGNCSMIIKMPIHIRYHAPLMENISESLNDSLKDTNQEYQQYFNFSLKKPRLLVSKCKNYFNQFEQSETYLTQNSFKLPCEKNTKIRNDYLFYLDENNSSLLNSSLVKYSSHEECEWSEILFDNRRSVDNLEILLPIGKKDHEIIILIVTLVFLTFLALNLLRFARKKVETVKCYINKGKNNTDNNSENEENENLNKN